MLVAVLSDIHGNRHALEAVLADVSATGVQDVWCLGDVVGYGADPNDCVALVQRSASLCLAGNHDLAVTGELSLDDFSGGAAAAARWTREVLTPEALAFLSGLRSQGVAGDFGLYHASPRDPVWEYVLSELLAELCFDVQPERLGLVGHSHVALSFERSAGSPASGAKRPAGEVADLASREWLLNPGSVGQPRDGDPRAAWLLLDLERASATWMRTPYDIAGAAASIHAAGLPASLADRLELGQ
jgi:diadenosine tetraphosphatase ApaH/serine/threonine PP2A family protein phosphatase